jgi:4-(2-carboxyphenyl)-2-oxobut-3-enoate aldolase
MPISATPITADTIRGALAILPAPSVPDADRWSCECSVDLPETARMVSFLLDAGLSIFMTGGSFGEGASLTEAEHEALTDCIVRTLGGRGLLFAGATTLNTRDTIARARRLVALGADGLFLGRPMWMSLDAKSIVRFYRDVAEALPGVPVVVYDNQFAFKAKIPTEVYADLSRIPEIVATKHIGGPSMADDLRAVEGRMRVLPVDSQWGALARAFPDEAVACWSGNAADGPEPLVWLAEAVARRDYDRVDRICERMAWAQAPMFPGGRLENFVDYNIPIAHARLEGSGLVRSGPPRPPYVSAPEAHLEGGRETGRRWESLRRELAPVAGSAAAE